MQCACACTYIARVVYACARKVTHRRPVRCLCLCVLSVCVCVCSLSYACVRMFVCVCLLWRAFACSCGAFAIRQYIAQACTYSARRQERLAQANESRYPLPKRMTNAAFESTIVRVLREGSSARALYSQSPLHFSCDEVFKKRHGNRLPWAWASSFVVKPSVSFSRSRAITPVAAPSLYMQAFGTDALRRAQISALRATGKRKRVCKRSERERKYRGSFYPSTEAN